MFAKNLMDGLTTYIDPEELAATAVAHEQSVIIITLTLTPSIISETMLPE